MIDGLTTRIEYWVASAGGETDFKVTGKMLSNATASIFVFKGI
jgi:hypothetical protein